MDQLCPTLYSPGDLTRSISQGFLHPTEPFQGVSLNIPFINKICRYPGGHPESYFCLLALGNISGNTNDSNGMPIGVTDKPSGYLRPKGRTVLVEMLQFQQARFGQI